MHCLNVTKSDSLSESSYEQCGQKGGIFPFCGIFGPKGGQIFEDGDLWELFKKGGILKNFTKIGKFSYFSTKC